MTRLGTAAIPLMIVVIVGFGMAKGVAVFDVFIEGAKEGLAVAVRILPALVALVTAVGMLRASGGLEWLTGMLALLGRAVGLPAEVLPLTLLRPLSGSGALAIFRDLLAENGADSFVGRVASVMMGSTETTFYTIAVYYGAAGVRDARHTVYAALMADVTGFLMSALAVRLLFY